MSATGTAVKAKDALERLAEDISLFDDPEEKYSYIIDAGKTLPPLEESYKTEAYKVPGCVSSVWLVTEEGENGILLFKADSDAFIVKGLLALALRVYSGKTPEDILAVPGEALAKALDLQTHLSRSRNNGFRAVTERIAIAAGKRVGRKKTG